MLRCKTGTVILLAAAITIFAPAASAQSHTKWHEGQGPCQVQTHPQAIIRCVAQKLGVSVQQALDVAECESHFYPRAENGQYKGLYQQAATYWTSRMHTYIPRRWFPQNYTQLAQNGWFNARLNTLLSLKMARQGWSPWAGCA